MALDEVVEEGMSRRQFLGIAGAAGLTTLLSPSSLFGFLGRENENVEIFIASLKPKTNPERKTFNKAVDAYIAWHPNGKEIAWVSNRFGRFEILTKDLEKDGPPIRRTHSMIWAIYPVYSYDGKEIIYIESVKKGSLLRVIGTDKVSEPKTILDLPNTLKIRLGNRNLCPDPAGRNIIASLYEHEIPDNFLIDLDNSELRRIIELPKTNEEFLGRIFPTFSKDGSKIAYVLKARYSKYGGRLYVANKDGSDNNPLLGEPYECKSSLFSPEGKRLVFNTIKYRRNDLYIVNIDGSGLTPLTHDGKYRQIIGWVDDRIFYVGGNGLYSIKEDGTNINYITRVSKVVSSGPLPKISPDGKRVAFNMIFEDNNEK